MASFAIIAIDAPGTAAVRAETRPRHLDHLHGVRDRIVVAGPLLGDDGMPIGSLIVGTFDDLAAAQAFADADPYARAGLFAEVRVTAWRQVLPEAG